MELKRKWKRFWTLTRHRDGGFTLVELVVVIAVLAILAGIGTAGYSGYIKNANKNADKILVGNIIRAIETGTNSTMFVNDNSFIKGATVFPVGVISLTKDGCKVQVSAASVQTSTHGPCDIKSIKIVPEGAYTYESKVEQGGIINSLHQIYSVDESKLKEVPYCVTHANVLERTVYTKWTVDGCDESPDDAKTYIFEKDCTGAYDLHGDHKPGEVLTEDNLSSYGTIIEANANTNHALYDSMEAAFGDVSSLSLSYDGWGSAEDGGHTYATLLAYTDTMIADIKDMADSLIGAVTAAAALGKDITVYLTEQYTSAADMMDSFSTYLVAKYPTVELWMEQWNGAANGDTVYAFGLGNTRDYTYGARTAYNIGFASYCAASNVDEKYIEVIKDFHHKAEGIIPIPDVVNTSAFANKTDHTDENSLYGQFYKAGDTDGTAFAQCAQLFELYKVSEACKKNGEVFYDTMHTVNRTGSDAFASGNGGSNAYFDYYSNYMKEMSAFHQVLTSGETNESGIMIFVTVRDGLVSCEVTPASANPRNQ